MPGNHSVYLLTRNGVVVYVGLTNGKVFHRIGAHAYRKDFDGVSIIECDTAEEAMEVEAKMIVKLRPEYNGKLDNPESAGMIGMEEIKKMLGVSHEKVARKRLENAGIKEVQFGRYRYYDRQAVMAETSRFRRLHTPY